MIRYLTPIEIQPMRSLQFSTNRYLAAGRISLIVILLSAGFADRAAGQTSAKAARDSSWRQVLQATLPAFGHRNWIVVADSAYPEQSREGLQTVISGEGQIDVLKAVLSAIGSAKHVSPTFYTDQELRYLDDAEIPGIAAYRQSLDQLLRGAPVSSLPHEQVIARLDEIAKTFRVLLIKTTMTMPYTSVFIQLDCKYWTADQELALRRKIADSTAKTH